MEDLRVDGGELEGDIGEKVIMGCVEGVLGSEVEGVGRGPLETFSADVVSSTENLLAVGIVSGLVGGGFYVFVIRGFPGRQGSKFYKSQTL